jgi:hypothetical protein
MRQAGRLAADVLDMAGKLAKVSCSVGICIEVARLHEYRIAFVCYGGT